MWILLLQFAFIIVMLAVVMQSRRKQKIREADLQQQHLFEVGSVKAQLLQAQLNPHFMFNALNSINHLVLANKNEQASAYLIKFSQLLRIQLDVAELPSIPLSKELDMIRLYLHMESLRFSGSFNWQVVVNPTLNPNDLSVPPMIIQPYVENALLHGLMHKHGEKHLQVLVEAAEAQSLLIRIIDNGIGMDASTAKRQDRGEIHEPIGMSLGQKRMEILALNDPGTRVEVVQLKDAHNAISGTEIKLYLRKRTIQST